MRNGIGLEGEMHLLDISKTQCCDACVENADINSVVALLFFT